MKGTLKNKIKLFFSPIDLTQGTIWKKILLFFLPIFVSYILQQMYSVADSAICGQTLSATEIAGINDTSSISFIFLQFAFGCTAGMSVILSNRIGENNADGTRKAFATQIVLSIFICAIITAISLICIDPLLSLIGIAPSDNETNNKVYESAHLYLSIICGGMAGQFFYNSICCVLRSMGDSVTPLIFLIISSTINVALDLLFIICFHWGVAGAAAATVISQAVSAIGCFVFIFVRYKEMRLHLSDFKSITFKSALKPLFQGVPLGLQFSILAFGMLTMSNGVIAFDKTADGVMVDGIPAQIGFGVANKILNMLYMPFSALGTAMISFCGQNKGADRNDRIRSGVRQALLIMLITFVIMSGVGLLLTINGAYQYIFLGKDKINSETIRYGNLFLYSDLPLGFLVGTLHILRNSLQGINKPVFPFLAGIAELLGRIPICIFLPPLINGGAINCEASNLSFYSLCLADPGAWLLADIILITAAIIFIFRKQKKSNVIEKKLTAG